MDCRDHFATAGGAILHFQATTADGVDGKNEG
jgi:hypothetical protein